MPAEIDFAALLELEAEELLPLRFLAEAGYLALALGESERSRAIFEGLAALAPASPVGPLGLAEAFLALGRPRKAEDAARQASLLPGITPEEAALTYSLRAEAQRAAGRPEQAAETLRLAIELAPESPGAADAHNQLEELRNGETDPPITPPSETDERH